MFLITRLIEGIAFALGTAGVAFTILIIWDEPECPKSLIK